jgi:hypothetical protein
LLRLLLVELAQAVGTHVSQKMLEHYSHIRLEAKRSALDVIGKTRHDTVMTQSPNVGGKVDSQVIENIGGREGIRTPGLLVANEALSQLSYSPTSSRENFNRGSQACQPSWRENDPRWCPE